MKKESYEKLKALIESDEKMRDSFLKLSEEGKSELIDRLFGSLVHKRMVEKIFKRENERKDELRLISIKKEAMKAARLQIRKSVPTFLIAFISTLLFCFGAMLFSTHNRGVAGSIWFSLWITALTAVFCFGGVLLAFLNAFRSSWRGFEVSTTTQYQHPKEILGLIAIFNIFCTLGCLVYALEPEREQSYSTQLQEIVKSAWPLYALGMIALLIWLGFSYLEQRSKLKGHRKNSGR